MRYLALFAAILLFWACESTTTNTINNSQKIDSTASTIIPKKSTNNISTTIHKIDTNLSTRTDIDSSITATYERADMYAGSTMFYFKDKNGKEIMVQNSNLEEEQTVEMPNNMMNPSTDPEDLPPGENPELAGKMFVLSYVKGAVVKLELAK